MKLVETASGVKESKLQEICDFQDRQLTLACSNKFVKSYSYQFSTFTYIVTWST